VDEFAIDLVLEERDEIRVDRLLHDLGKLGVLLLRDRIFHRELGVHLEMMKMVDRMMAYPRKDVMMGGRMMGDQSMVCRYCYVDALPFFTPICFGNFNFFFHTMN
jgi:hypothetical protein